MNTSNDNGGSRANSEPAIDGLLNGIKTFGIGADTVGHIFKHVFDVVSGFVGRTGNEEDVAVHLEKIIEYIQKTPDLAGNLLHCYILYRVAQVFTQQKHMEKAKEYFYSAQKIAASRRSELEFIKWEIGIRENLMSIHDALGEKELLLRARMEYVETCEPILRSPPAGWLSENVGRILVGVARAWFGIGVTHKVEKEIHIGIGYLQEALSLEKDRKTSESSDSGVQPWIWLQPSELYCSTDSEIGQCVGQFASWNFLQQSIAGFQQVGCTCSSHSIDSSLSTLSWEEKGMSDCARHQLLADAYIFQGRVQQNHGFMVEAQKSFEEGLYLVKQCKDMKRESWFHLELAHHLFLKSHICTNSCLHVEDSPQYTKFLSQQIVGHYKDFLKRYTQCCVCT